MTASYRFGIEEEYFLADAGTRGTPRRGLRAFHAAAGDQLSRVERELLQSQVEVSTPPSTSFEEAEATLRTLRAGLAEVGRAHGILVFAAGTHPVAQWSRQRPTEADRYVGLMRELRMLGQRNVVCGLHVHVEVPEPDARVDLMNRLIPFMPILLALSASSPFWQARATGMAGYRLSAFGEMPRTGLPDHFHGDEDYQRYLRVMTGAGAIKDASFVWWAMRPSKKYPTLELRVADSCTRVEDTLAIAALYRCLVRLVGRRPDLNAALTGTARAVAAENMWLAGRDGVRASLVDEASEGAIPFAAALDALLDLVAEDADALGCRPQVEGARRIVATGTSADRQVEIFEANAGLVTRSALNAVVDWLAAVTAGAEAPATQDPVRESIAP